jgi:hypothetical protein
VKFIILFIHYFTIFFCLSLSISAQDTILVDVLNFRNPIRQLVKDADGKIYIQTYEGVYVLNDKGFEKSSFKLSNFERIGVKNGMLTKLNHYKPGYESFSGSQSWHNYLSTNGTKGFCQVVVDFKGNYWVINGSKFLHCFNIIKSFNKSLPNVSIRGITKFNRDLIVLSHSGLFLNREKIEIEHLGSSTNVITHNNKVYFASSSSAVYSFDVNAKNCTKIIDEKKNEPLGEISSLLQKDNTLYLGTYKGLFSIDNNDQITNEIEGIGIQNIGFVQNKLSVCTNEGIYHQMNGSFQRNNLFPTELIFNDLKEKDNKLFAASSAGIWYLDKNSKKAINLLQNTLFEQLECFSIEFDQLDHIWVGTSKGLLRINYLQQNIELYLDGVEFNKRSSYYNKDKLYFGSISGLYEFSPSDFLVEDKILVKVEKLNYSNMEILLFGIIVFTFCILMMYLYFKSQIDKIKKFQITNNTESIPFIETDDTLLFKEYEDSLFLNDQLVEPQFSMENIEVFILKNIESITAESLREASGYSKYIFYKNFSRYYDISPKQLIENLRKVHLSKKKN